MSKVTEALENVLNQMSDEELKMLAHSSDEGLYGLTEKGGEKFRILSNKEMVSDDLSLKTLLDAAEQAPMDVMEYAGERLDTDFY